MPALVLASTLNPGLMITAHRDTHGQDHLSPLTLLGRTTQELSAVSLATKGSALGCLLHARLCQLSCLLLYKGRPFPVS